MWNQFLRNLPSLISGIAISVSLGFAQTPATTRIEQSDPGVSFSGSWNLNSNELHSRGSALFTNTEGSRASITFIGTGITWIGILDPWSGLARVYVDGTLSNVDTYGSRVI